MHATVLLLLNYTISFYFQTHIKCLDQQVVVWQAQVSYISCFSSYLKLHSKSLFLVESPCFACFSRKKNKTEMFFLPCERQTEINLLLVGQISH